MSRRKIKPEWILNWGLCFRDDGTVVDYFEDTVKMSTYLVAFIVSDFSFKEGIVGRKTKTNDVKFKIWARNNAIEQVNYLGCNES